MENRKQIYATLEDGREVAYDVILTFHNDHNNKNYIVYTDNSYDQENKLKIYASIYDPFDNRFVSHPTTEEEWYEIHKVLDAVFVQS